MVSPTRTCGVTQVRIVNSEWIKFRSLRSTWWSIGVALLISVGLGHPVLRSARAATSQQHGGFEPDQTALSLRGFYLAQLAVGVLGVLFITGEYSTGMIRATLSAVPKRMPVWLAKIVDLRRPSIFLDHAGRRVRRVPRRAGRAELHQVHGRVFDRPERRRRRHRRPRLAGTSLGRVDQPRRIASGRSSAPPCT